MCCANPSSGLPPPPNEVVFQADISLPKVDYRSFLNMKWDAMPAEEFVDMASNPKFLGNKLLKTQHFIGASKWEKISDTEIIGRHQVRVAHQKYADESFKDVVLKGHAHGGGTMLYKKVDGVWKFAGLCPDTRWFQHDYDKIFLDSKDHFTQE